MIPRRITERIEIPRCETSATNINFSAPPWTVSAMPECQTDRRIRRRSVKVTVHVGDFLRAVTDPRLRRILETLKGHLAEPNFGRVHVCSKHWLYINWLCITRPLTVPEVDWMSVDGCNVQEPSL